MSTNGFKRNFLASILCFSFAFFVLSCNKSSSSAPASKTNFTAALDGAQETPAVTTSATGTLMANYDSTTNVISYTLTWTNLSAVPTAMHFHTGDIGVAGDVVLPISGFSAATSGTLTATATVPQNEELNLLKGEFYVNIHTSYKPSGEIRGQVLIK